MAFFKKRFNKPVLSVQKLLHTALGYTQKRTYEKVYTYDITGAQEFCAREFALGQLEHIQRSIQKISVALDMTFQQGRFYEAQIRTQLPQTALFGRWQCQHCGKNYHYTYKPTHCRFCFSYKGIKKGLALHKDFIYKGMYLQHPNYKYNAGIDIVLRHNHVLNCIEIKTIKDEEFGKLTAPLPQHILQVLLYLDAIKTEQLRAKKSRVFRQFDITQAHIVYCCKGFGKFDAGVRDISPYKEYIIYYDRTKLPLQQLEEFGQFKQHHIMPHGVCEKITDKRAKQCPLKNLCFQQKYIGGNIYATGN